MRIGIVAEPATGEQRVAITPRAAGSLLALGADVVVPSGSGEAAGFSDQAYAESGATVVPRWTEAARCEVVVVITPPWPALLAEVVEGALLCGFLDPYGAPSRLTALRDRRCTGLAFEAAPRTTLAQSVDALSSQATAAGYAAAVLAAHQLPKLFPMLTTAAGTVPPARVLVIGAGVAGLQAMATARRLGAIVSGYDIRAEAAEQIASVGARIVPTGIDDAPSSFDGYAAEVSADSAARQRAALAPHVTAADAVITTAAVPGRPAPLLIDGEMVSGMRPGSVIVDLAAASGGNCAVSRADEVVHVGSVTVLAPTNLPGEVARDASELYARNVVALLERVVRDGRAVIDLDDPIVGAMCVVHQGRLRGGEGSEMEEADRG
jgi:H+-translocating NAD(P) transhydrogenase subunit alpha